MSEITDVQIQMLENSTSSAVAMARVEFNHDLMKSGYMILSTNGSYRILEPRQRDKNGDFTQFDELRIENDELREKLQHAILSAFKAKKESM